MKFFALLKMAAATLFSAAFLIAMSSGPVQAGMSDQVLEWQTIFGIPQAFNVVGSGSGQVGGGAPWYVSSGHAKVNLTKGKVNFKVNGLVLAVGSEAAIPLFGLDIGTPAGVTEVKGTVVCNVSGSTNGGNSVLVDTAAVPLSAQGNASFSGSVGPFPAECGTSDIAFLIRIVEPTPFANLWIAAGGVLVVNPDP
jgi:hypothetical protein